MKNKLFIIIIILFFSSCSSNKVVKHHGVHFLEKKQKKIEVFSNNLNDVRFLLGPPSTKNSFDTDIWIYIERKTTVSQVRTLGKRKLLVNNVLILEFDNRGLLIKKNFFDKGQMNKIKISKNETEVLSKKDTFIRSVITSLKHKINDPLGKRTIK
jgi:outer membrane protein assembly factor BamE (lipoprotein component of BamABCDE complex)